MTALRQNKVGGSLHSGVEFSVKCARLSGALEIKRSPLAGLKLGTCVGLAASEPVKHHTDTSETG